MTENVGLLDRWTQEWYIEIVGFFKWSETLT